MSKNYIMKLAKILIAIVLMAQPHSVLAEEASKYQKVRELFFSQIKEHGDEMNTYVEQSTSSINSAGIDEKGNCYRLNSGIVTQILILDENGMITDTAFSANNAKARCFEESFLGQYFPKPPFAPLYIEMDMM